MNSLSFLLIATVLLTVPSAFSKDAKHKASTNSETSTENQTTQSPGKAVRIPVRMKDVYQKKTPSRRIRFFVKTDSIEVPIVTIADIAHFPRVSNVSARERHVDDMSGVVIDVGFEEEVSPETHKKAALAINLWQPNLTKKEYPIYPTDGHKVIKAKAEKE